MQWIIDSITSFGNTLSPASVLLQFLLWGTGGATICWRLTRKIVVNQKTAIEKMQHDIVFWEKKYIEAEKQYRSLVKSAEGNPEANINSIISRIRGPGGELEADLVEGWIQNQSELLAELFATSAEHLVFAASSCHALEVPLTRASVARLLDAKNQRYRELERAIDTLRALDETNAVDEPVRSSDQSPPLEESALRALDDAFAKAFYQNEHLLAALLGKRMLEEVSFQRGPKHGDVALWNNNLGVALTTLGRHNIALKYFETCHDIEDRLDAETLAMHRISYGACLLGLRRDEEAITMLESIRDDAERIFGDDHPHVTACDSCMVIGYFRLQRFQEMLPIAKKRILREIAERPGDMVPVRRILTAYKELGMFDNAIDFAENLSAAIEKNGATKEDMVELDTYLQKSLTEMNLTTRRMARLKHVLAAGTSA